jgi:hypothetical protein
MAKKGIRLEPGEQPLPGEVQAAQGKITKTEAVKRAVAAGHDAPAEGVIYIKRQFGLDVTNQQFSTYKSKAKTEGGTSSSGRTRRAVGTQSTSSHGLVAIDDLEAAKALVAKVGVEQAKRLVGLFG